MILHSLFMKPSWLCSSVETTGEQSPVLPHKEDMPMKPMITTVALTLALVMSFAVAEARPYRWQGNQQNTYGWQLMTPEERTEHQTKLRGFSEYAACKEYVDEHHKKMEERAKEKGITAPLVKRNPCDVLKARGVLK
jgi:hypothetical protein